MLVMSVIILWYDMYMYFYLVYSYRCSHFILVCFPQLSQLPSLSQLEHHFHIQDKEEEESSSHNIGSMLLPLCKSNDDIIPSPTSSGNKKSITQSRRTDNHTENQTPGSYKSTTTSQSVHVPPLSASITESTVPLVPPNNNPPLLVEDERIIDTVENGTLTNVEEGEETCDICGDDTSFVDDPIVFCSACNVPVHKACYGIDVIPPGDWLCDYCLASNNNNNICQRQCVLCPNRQGALKECSEGGVWAHTCCIIWTPETLFLDPDHVHLPSSKSIKSIATKKRKAACVICNIQGQGSCIPCDYHACKNYMHIWCAMNRHNMEGVKCKMIMREDKKLANGIKLLCYCPTHANENANECATSFKKGSKNKRLSIEYSSTHGNTGAINSGRRDTKRVKRDHDRFLSSLDNMNLGENDCSDVVMLLTGSFTVAQLSKVNVLCESVKGLTMVDEWDETVTHVITQTTVSAI